MKHKGTVQTMQICRLINSFVVLIDKVLGFSGFIFHNRRCSGLVVEGRTPEREVGRSLLTQVPMLCP